MADFAKKLTVSFGAFSCTLSGFDDPFPVMRQVVDYFQGLAQRDPHFGAHPERPDTETLRAMAEKTSGLAVNAQTLGDEVILSSDVEAQDVESYTDVPASSFEDAVVIETGTAPEARTPDAETDQATVQDVFPAAQPQNPKFEFDDTVQDADQDDVAEDESELEVYELDAPLAADEHLDSEPPAFATDIEILSKEAVAFDDVASEDHPIDVPKIDTGTASEDDIETDTATVDASSDAALPEWAAELVSDEPVDEINPDEELAQSALAEDQAIERILALTESNGALSSDNPLQDFVTDEVQLGEVADVQEPEIEADPVYEPELQTEYEPFHEPEVDTGFDADIEDAVEPVAEIEVEADLDPEPSSETEREFTSIQDMPAPKTKHVNQSDAPLQLGFGDRAGLDATKDVPATFEDTRTTPDVGEVLSSIGVEDEDFEEFDWDSVEAAVASVQDDAQDVAPAPLLLTPQLAVVDDADPKAAPVDMSQDDPREDLREFASSVGAVSLPELLEASAAFTTLVNGRPNFSRGELLGMLDEVVDEEHSREEQIACFGSLLRGGRIKITQNGQYEISNDALSTYETRLAG